MNINYLNTIDQIYNLNWIARKLAAQKRMESFIKELFPDGLSCKFLQVTGTNGKSSTTHFLEAGFSLHGKSGSVTSPHLFDYRERFSINCKKATQLEITDIWENKILPLCVEAALKGENEVPLYSQIFILMALVLFERHKVRWAILETGVGGRYSPIMALDVIGVIVTNVGDDHENILGKKQWQRAMEKGGACRRGTPLFTMDKNEETLNILEEICNHNGSIFHHVSKQEIIEVSNKTDNKGVFNTSYQKSNAALSLSVIRHFLPKIDTNLTLEKMAKATITCRFQQIEEGIYADIAHNPDKIQAMATHVETQFPKQKIIFVVGLSGDRDPIAVFTPLLKIASLIIIAGTGHKEVHPESIKKAFYTYNSKIPVEVIIEPSKAVERAKTLRNQNDIIVITGSGYLLDQALNPDNRLRFLNTQYEWRDKNSD
jgi:dihydrofolate synthase / folylpolyglutamate synthase